MTTDGYLVTGEIWRHPGDAGWYFLTLPEGIADELRARFAGEHRPFGSLRVRATLGATTWDTSLQGSAVLVADEERFDLRPGVMARVGADQRRRILPGEDGIRFIALGGLPGAYTSSPWTQLGGPLPVPAG
jgi:hypothetical protein